MPRRFDLGTMDLVGDVFELPLAYLRAVEEANEAADGLTRLLVELGHEPEPITGWWAFQSFEELDDRTPSRAWLDGMHEEVRRLVVALYERTTEAQQSAVRDEAFVETIRVRLAELRRSELGPAESA
jgi:hypothetical protein